MVTVKSFTYTKENGDVSNRVVAVLRDATTNVLGIDLSHLDNEDYHDFIEDFREFTLEVKEAEAELLDRHDLKHNYRAFKLSGISNITNTEL